MNPSLSTPRLFRALLWVQWRSLLARVRGVRRQSPLLLFVLGSFIAGYLVVGYALFHWGLGFLYNYPFVGSLLSRRILFLIFGFFFVMLMFSNLIIGYSTLFKNRETSWFLSLPITHRNVYRWKFLESLVVSSWALIFLSAPMMAAYGHVHQVPLIFYGEVVLLYLPFVVLPGLLGSWSILLLVRILPRRGVKKALLLIASALVLLLLFGINPVRDTEAMSSHDVLSFEQLLRHTRISLNPWLPSAWLAKSVLAWGEGLATQGAFYFLVLLSNALFGLFLGFEVVGRMYYESWTRALSSRAERFQRAAEEKKMRVRRPGLLERTVHALLPDSSPTAALVLKDVRLFWRDPTQWIQFMIFFGLLCIYVLNLRNVAFDFTSPFWTTMVSYLNLTASSLTLSTLTTRFVFPQFSLEGRRIWILGLAPVGMQHVVLQKFWMSCVTSMAITVSLMVASSLVLNLAWTKIAFFALAIALMSATLSGLAVGLGALYPNFKEDNPSKIVSGFGGTLCLVVSFVYISLFVALLAIPDLRHVTKVAFFMPDAPALAFAVVLSFGILAVPMAAALKRVKNLEI